MQVLYTLFKSYSQVFLQNSWILGALIAIGLAVASPSALLLSFIGVCSSTGLALMLSVPKSLIETGVYGFNSVLIGIAASVFIKHVPTAIVVTIVASVVATLVFYLFNRNHLTALTFPFVLLGWTIILTAKYFK